MTNMGTDEELEAKPAPSSPTQEHSHRENGWNECDAHARHIDEHGRETVVVCTYSIHAGPGDAEAEHHDERLGIFWRYSDDLVFDD